MSATRLGVLRCPAVREAGEEQAEGSQLLQGWTVCLRGAEWGGHLDGWPFSQHVTRFAKGGDFELLLSRHRGSAKEQEKGGIEVQRDTEGLWAATLKKPREGLIAGGPCLPKALCLEVK